MALLWRAKFVIPRPWYRAQKPLKPGDMQNKDEKIGHPPRRVRPRKHDKIQIRKGSFKYFRDIFIVGLYFTSHILASPRWGILRILGILFCICGLEVLFLCSISGNEDRGITTRDRPNS